MPTNSTVRLRGKDTSGRDLYASDKLWSVWKRICADERVADFIDKIPIVQGSWMSKVPGGGADDSVGFHDKGGTFDVRTRDVTSEQIDTFVWVASEYGFHFWRRDQSAEHGGMAPHAHGVFGYDDDLAPGLARQWTAVLAGYDGLGHLGRGGPDYEKRPRPLPIKPPQEDDMTPAQVNLLKNAAADAKAARAASEEAREIAKRTEKSVLDGRRTANVRSDAERKRDINLALSLKEQGKSVDEIAEALKAQDDA